MSKQNRSDRHSPAGCRRAGLLEPIFQTHARMPVGWLLDQVRLCEHVAQQRQRQLVGGGCADERGVRCCAGVVLAGVPMNVAYVDALA